MPSNQSLVGAAVENWSPPPRPRRSAMHGDYCIVEPLHIEKHSAELFHANQQDQHSKLWTYLPYGPFDTLSAYQRWLAATCIGDDPMFFSLIDRRTGVAAGVASYLRINPAAGSIEVGHINFSPSIQNTPIGSEAMYLMMQHVFELGYRRYEWKCNALNQKSRTSAMRLGFRYEGTFRQMMVVKGRNRDSAWFSVLDKEWYALQSAFQTWLAKENFTANGVQRQSLSALTADALQRLP